MTNPIKRTTLALLAVTAVITAVGASQDAEAIAINRCTRIVQDQAGRETVVNVCKECVTVNLERRRPGTGLRTPDMRSYNLPPASRQPLAFRGPGVTRIMGETPCPSSSTR